MFNYNLQRCNSSAFGFWFGVWKVYMLWHRIQKCSSQDEEYSLQLLRKKVNGIRKKCLQIQELVLFPLPQLVTAEVMSQ